MRVLAIDLDNVFRRNWEASQGKELQQAHLRTLRFVEEIRDGWDRVVIACDGGPSFRKLKCPEYKANRIDPGEPYREQRRRTIDRLRADGCNIVVGPEVEPGGWAEADDVLAWIAEEHEQRSGGKCHLRIVSGDGDLEGLASDASCIDILKPGSPDVWNEKAITARRGVPPAKVYDVKALAGDASDNYKGFPSCGPKWAAWLVNTFGGALEVFGKDAAGKPNLDHTSIKAALRATLVAGGIDLAARGLFLARPRTDLGLDFEALVVEPAQRTAIPETRTYFEPEPAPESEPPPPVDPVRHRAETGAVVSEFRPPTPRVVGTLDVSDVARIANPEPAPVATTPEPRESSVGMVVREARAIERPRLDPMALQPHGLSELQNLADCLYNSRMYPQFPNTESIMAAVIEARERGIPAGTALRNAYVVKGRLAWSASYIAGLVLASGKARVFKIVKSTPTEAVLRYARTDDDDPPADFIFGIDEARQAGWMKSGERGDGKWLTNPRTMLRWAAMREAARAFFPDCVSGVLGPDELRNGHVEDAEFEASADV